ncbi:MAG: hypothetical protein K2J10_02585 [Muribaculaceae bacterium]|nr:hypothetical protein [Muribaculaceae bacterium]
MKILKYILITILLIWAADLNAKIRHDDAAKFEAVEINVLDYPFMRDIANFVKHTNHDTIFPQYNKVRFENEYCFYIKDDNLEMQKVIPFKYNGSYSITVSLSIGDEPYFFEVDSVRFHTFDSFVPYFNSCNRNKVAVNEDIGDINCRAFWYYFWFFEVKDGKVVDAIYYYEPTDDGYDKYDVYDLIRKEYIPYKVWKSQIHPTE